MEAVRCISIRESKPEQITLHRIYWVDENTKYTDTDGTTYATVYADISGNKLIGNLDMAHFRTYFDYLHYGLTLSHYINSYDGVLLGDVIDFCEKNKGFDCAARNVLKYINEKGYHTPENLFREFFIKSMPFKYAVENNKKQEYLSYVGYSVEPVGNV